MANAFIHLKLEPEDKFSLFNQVFEFHTKDIHMYIEHILSRLQHFYLYDSNLLIVLLPHKFSGLCDKNIQQHDDYSKVKVQIMLSNEY